VAGHRFASDDLDGAVSALEAAVQRWPGRKGVPGEVSAQLSEYRRARLLRQNPAAHSN
jgi:vacuolar-type H+-ATPase subunit B/Vma2